MGNNFMWLREREKLNLLFKLISSEQSPKIVLLGPLNLNPLSIPQKPREVLNIVHPRPPQLFPTLTQKIAILFLLCTHLRSHVV